MLLSNGEQGKIAFHRWIKGFFEDSFPFLSQANFNFVYFCRRLTYKKWNLN